MKKNAEQTGVAALRRATPASDPDADIAARAAWLHFVGGLTQSEVAKRLQVTTTRVHRYVTRAQNEGLVRVFVDMEASDVVRLENSLIDSFGLRFCHVALEAAETGPLPLRALSSVGASYLMRVATASGDGVIGVGNGRTLAATVDAMGKIDCPKLRFVSMLGGLTRSYAANPHDVIHRLARKTNAEAYLLPAPLFANSPEDKRVMTAQHGIAATMQLIAEARLVIIGVGSIAYDPGGQPAAALGGEEALGELYAKGARAEIMGQFIDVNGRLMETPYDKLVMATELTSLRGRDVVAIAGGEPKTEAIEAALKSGLLSGLIIDEATARRLVDRAQAEQSDP